MSGTFVIVTKRISSGPEWHNEETRLFESAARPENLEANYRNWLKRWADEGSFDLRYETFEILGAYRAEPIDRPPSSAASGARSA